MAPRVRLTLGLVAAAAGMVGLVSLTTPSGGLGGLAGLTGADTGTSSTSQTREVRSDGYQVTDTYTPADPDAEVVTPTPVSDRYTTLIIPRIDLRVPVVKGTDDAALARGVGQWENDTEPGGKGNYVLAGHRVTNGEPFAELPALRPGDKVVVETADYRYVYEMDTTGDAYRVDDAELWPVDPLPRPMRGGPNRILTLITCAETFSTSDRYIAFGHLTAIHLRKGQ